MATDPKHADQLQQQGQQDPNDGHLLDDEGQLGVGQRNQGGQAAGMSGMNQSTKDQATRPDQQTGQGGAGAQGI